MEKYEIIRDTLKRHPEIMGSRQSLKSVLCDIFPTDKLIVNMCLMAYDEGMFSSIKRLSTVDRLAFEKYTNSLVADFGVTIQTAQNTVFLVASALSKNVITPIPILNCNIEPGPVPEPTNILQKAPHPKPKQVTPSAAKDFLYASNGTEVRINKYVGAGGNVVIPDYIDGLPVTRIADYAFDYKKYRNKITGIQLPNQLQYIGSGSFQNLEKLKGVLVLPPTLLEVDSHAFQSTDLTGLIIQSDCELGCNAFANIYGLEFVYVAKGCSPDIGWAVFGPTDSLKEVIIPKEVTHIEDETFEGCNEMVLFTPTGSYAAKYGRQNFIQVDSNQYEQRTDYFKSVYGI